MICKTALIHRTDNIISEEIREITDSYWNHAAVICLVEDEWFVIEAEYPKVRMMELNEWERINIGREIHYTSQYTSKVNPLKFVGKRYALGVFINRLGWYLCNKIKYHKGASWFVNRDPKGVYCFELCAIVQGLTNPWLATGNSFIK